jgi:tellurite resistance protein
MANHDPFDDRRRGLEAEYFHRQEQELIEKLRCRQQLAEATHSTNEELLRDLEELGYRRETLMLLYLVPLVQVAWAEGFITESEQRLIFEAARMRGIDEESAADKELTEWLKHKPSEEFFDKTLRLIRTILQALPPEEREHEAQDIISSCVRIAKAAHEFSIFPTTGHISAEEKQMLERIAAELELNRAEN